MTGARRAVGALVVSFAAYLVPLVGPHAAWLLGEVLWRELTGAVAREPAWIAAEVALALAAQAVLALLGWWVLGRPGWLRGLAAAIAILPLVAGLNYLYLIALPAHFLVEADTAPERPAWPVACAARGVWMPPIAGPISVTADAPIWVAASAGNGRYGLLDAERCAVRSLRIGPSGGGFVAYAAGRRALYVTTAPPDARQTWSVFDTETEAETPLPVGQGQAPILSRDGSAAAWLRPVAGATPPIQLEAVLRSVDGGAERVVSLLELGRGGLQLVELDADAGTLIVARGLRELLTVDLGGRVLDTLTAPPELEPQPHTFRLLPDGWVAWDAYRDAGAYRVAWSLAAGKGSFRLPKGRSVTSLAPSADGRFIALSMTSALSIGSTRDAVVVIRTADGAEAFRRYFPKYTRSTVAFAAPGRFLYSDLQGVNALRIE